MLNKFRLIFAENRIKDYLIKLGIFILLFLNSIYFFSSTKLIIYSINKNNREYIFYIDIVNCLRM